MKLLILGSKEYPLGVNKGDDALPSGGIEVHVESFVKGLQHHKNFEIMLITRAFDGAKETEITSNLKVYRTPWLKGFFIRNLSFNFMAFLKALRVECDIVHSHTQIATFFGLILSKVKGVPLVATPHGLAFEQPQYNPIIRKIFWVLENYAYSRANYVVFLSEEEKNRFLGKLKFLPQKYEVINPGIEIERFERRDPEKIKKEFDIEEKKVITFVGRLIKVKGVIYLLKAVLELKNNFILLIVGGGVQRKELEKFVDKMKIKNVIFTGERSDIPEILAATDIFVLPSLSEGLPTSLLEALAAGKACIVTNIGLPVENNVDGIVVKAADPQGLKKALRELLDNEGLRKKLGKNAKNKARTQFSWENAIASHINLYTKLAR
jgi:glycosyltransferase involved in cell wall biosynthesis